MKRLFERLVIRAIAALIAMGIMASLAGSNVHAATLPKINLTPKTASGISNPDHYREVDFGENGENYNAAMDEITVAIANFEDGVVIYNGEDFIKLLKRQL